MQDTMEELETMKTKFREITENRWFFKGGWRLGEADDGGGVACEKSDAFVQKNGLEFEMEWV